MRPIGDPPVGWPEFDYSLPPGKDDKATVAPYKPLCQFTGHPTLDGMLTVWHGAVTRAGPPSWKDLADKIWHPWSTSLLLVESRGDGKPLQSVEAFPVATTLLGLPLFFKGALPMDTPQMTELAEMARQVTELRLMIPRILPATVHAEWNIRPAACRRRAAGAGPGVVLARADSAGAVRGGASRAAWESEGREIRWGKRVRRPLTLTLSQRERGTRWRKNGVVSTGWSGHGG